jgi:hypothetical protein
VAPTIPTRKHGRFATAVVLLAVAAASCSHDRAARKERPPRQDKFVEAVSARAPFDLTCPAAQVEVVSLGSASIGAIGCGRRASYTCLCTYHVWFNCTQAQCALDGAGLAPQPLQPEGTPEEAPPRPPPSATPIDA